MGILSRWDLRPMGDGGRRSSRGGSVEHPQARLNAFRRLPFAPSKTEDLMMKAANALHIAAAVVIFLLISTGQRICAWDFMTSTGQGICAGERGSEAGRPATASDLGGPLSPGRPILYVAPDFNWNTLLWLSWDTEGGGRVNNNLVRAAVSLKGATGDRW